MKQINGNVAIVLLLDDLVKEEVNKLSSVYSDNKIIFEGQGGEHVPHITLFQTKVENLKQEYVDDLLGNLSSKIPIEVSLNRITSFGNHFIFWNVDITKELIYLHEQALLISRFFNSEGEKQADREQLVLSEKQIQNVHDFGYPFVKKEWCPHITLSYTQGLPKNKQESRKINTQITKIAFVKVGEWGTIRKLLDVR